VWGVTSAAKRNNEEGVMGLDVEGLFTATLDLQAPLEGKRHSTKLNE